MNAFQFLKVILGVATTLLAVNSIGSLYFFQQLRTGEIQETSSDGHLGWEAGKKQEPSSRLNDMGIRESQNRETLLADSTPKLVLLGNSVVYGGGVHDKPVFSEILQKNLGNGIKVINAGKEAVEIWREFALYEKELSPLKPRLVVWFPSGNDFVPRASVSDKETETAKQNRFSGEFDWDLVLKPYFFQKMAQKIYFEHSILAENFLSSPHNLYYTQGILRNVPESVMAELSLEIRRFKEVLQKDGSQLVVVFLPTKMYAKLYGWQSANAYHQLGAIFKDQGIPFFQAVDLLHQKCSTACFLDYTHLNAQGHELIGNELSSLILSLLK